MSEYAALIARLENLARVETDEAMKAESVTAMTYMQGIRAGLQRAISELEREGETR